MHFDSIVIGAGQAGPAMAEQLAKVNVEEVPLLGDHDVVVVSIASTCTDTAAGISC